MTTAAKKTKTAATKSPCACGCGQRTVRRIRLLRDQDRGTAEQLRWAEMSIAPMRVSVAVARGHEDDGIDGYVTVEAE